MSVLSSILVSTEIRRDQKSSTYFFYKFKCCCVLSICKYVCCSSLSPLIQVILGNTGACCLSGCVEAQISLRMARPESEQSGHNPSWNFVVMLLLVPPSLAWPGHPGPPRNLQPVTELRPDLDTAGAARGTGNRL